MKFYRIKIGRQVIGVEVAENENEALRLYRQLAFEINQPLLADLDNFAIRANPVGWHATEIDRAEYNSLRPLDTFSLSHNRKQLTAN